MNEIVGWLAVLCSIWKLPSVVVVSCTWLQYLHFLIVISPAEISCLTFVLFCLVFWINTSSLPACFIPSSLKHPTLQPASCLSPGLRQINLFTFPLLRSGLYVLLLGPAATAPLILAFIMLTWYWIRTTVTHKFKGFTSVNIHQLPHIFPPAYNKLFQILHFC